MKVIGGVAVVLVALIALLLIFVDPEDEQSQPEPTTTATPVARVGEPVVMNGIAYTITGRRQSTKLGPYNVPQGIFVVVDVKFENVSNQPADASLTGWSLHGGNGKRYSLYHPASENTLALEIQPGFSERGRLVFDVTTAAARRARLIAEDCTFDLNSPDLDPTCVRRSFDLGLR